MKGHRDLVAWQSAMELVGNVYEVTRHFSKDEVYGLASQLRRAAVSVPSNIAEGYGRNSRKDFHRFLGQALGSLLEVETQLEIGCQSRVSIASCVFRIATENAPRSTAPERSEIVV